MANQRILATEEMVGYGHATKADTLNRLTMVEHSEAGVHGAVARASMGTAPLVLGSDADGDMYYRASSALARLEKGTAYKHLGMNSGATAPEWQASANSVLTAAGDILYASSANTLARLKKGTALAIPRMNSGATAPEWGAAGQIAFPATQNASSDANTLDDYEEGTWTPALASTGASWSYNYQNGVYTKIGRFLLLQAALAINTLSGTTTNAVTLGGLPFTIKFATGRSSLFLGMPIEPVLHTDSGATLTIRNVTDQSEMLASGIPSACNFYVFIIGHV